MAILIGIVFTAIGIFFIWLSRRTRVQSAAAAKWPAVPGQVLESRVYQSQGTDSDGNTTTSDNAHLVYQYQVGNQTYQCNRIAIGTSVASPRVLVSQHPVGAAVQVHYNPQNPAEAALFVKQSQGCLFMVFAAVFLFFGLITLLIGIVGHGS